MKDPITDPTGLPRSVGSHTNGQAFQAYMEAAPAALGSLTALDYYGMELPSWADEALRDILNAFTALSLPQRERFLISLSPGKRGLFGIFGHRAATIAVRLNDPDWLRLGLIGNVVANYDPPPDRKVDVALAVFYHCARKLAIEPEQLFDEAAEFASGEIAAHMRAFGRRDDMTLKQFGWREMRTPDGVRYQFDW